jgi:hypothetical protein
MTFDDCLPCDDLAGHLAPCVRKFSGQTEIRNLELSVRGYQQIVWFQILRESASYIL